MGGVILIIQKIILVARLQIVDQGGGRFISFAQSSGILRESRLIFKAPEPRYQHSLSLHVISVDSYRILRQTSLVVCNWRGERFQNMT